MVLGTSVAIPLVLGTALRGITNKPFLRFTKDNRETKYINPVAGLVGGAWMQLFHSMRSEDLGGS